MDKFKVIKGNKESIEENELIKLRRLWDLHDCWQRQFIRLSDRTDIKVSEISQEEIKKLSLTGIKYLSVLAEIIQNHEQLIGHVQSAEEAEGIFKFTDRVLAICGHLTVQSFVDTFPIDKTYNGEKFGCKDYFFTIDVLSQMVWDEPIGADVITDLIWDYCNNELQKVYAAYLTAAGYLYKKETGKGMLEQFCEDNGIETYIGNPIERICKKSPHLRVLK